MISVDMSDVYARSCGEGELKPQYDPFAVASPVDQASARMVRKRIVELWQSFRNLRDAVDGCGDSVRISVSSTPSGMELAAVAAALMDSDQRCVYLDVDDHDVLDSHVCRTLHAAEGKSDYIRRASRRLRRPA